MTAGASDGYKFLTPDESGSLNPVCRVLRLPLSLWPYFNGAYGELCEQSNWYEFGDMSPEDAAQYFSRAIADMRECPMIGSIAMYARDALPSGVLLCDGAEHDGADYPLLYAVIHDSLRRPGGRFVTPSLNGRFPLSVPYSRFAETGGAETHTLTVSEMPSHTHSYTSASADLDIEPPVGAPQIWAASVVPFQETGATGGNEAHENMPPYYGLVFGIIAA